MPSSTDFIVRRLAREYLSTAKKRETDGLTVYGDFDPEKDTRCLSKEAQDEAVDVFNYLKFLGEKHPSLKFQCTAIQAIACRLYIRLRVLQQKEERLTEEKGAGSESPSA